MNILTFDVKCVMLFLKIFRHFDENNDLGSSKTLKWVLIQSSFSSKGLFLDALASLALVITVRGVPNFSRLQIMRYLDFD